MTKVFVTGGTGFIGSHLVDRLIEKGYHVKCLVRATSSMKWLKDKPVELVHGTLFDEDALSNVIKDVSYVYHVGGVTFAKKPEEFVKGNVDATRSLISICHSVNPGIKRFVHVSTQAVVGPSPDGVPFDESAVYNPLTTYSRTKVEAEKIVKEYIGKMNCTIVRPPVVYGPRDVAVLEYFKPVSRGLMPLIGFREKLVSLIHCSDLVDGIILAGESEKASGGVYFLSSEKFYSWREIGEMTSKLMNKRTLRLNIPHFVVYTVGFFAQLFSVFSKKPAILNLEKCREITQRYWICSAEKARRELGFKEKLTLEDGLRNTIEWYKKEKWI